VAASGAYYVACAAKKVYANAGTITGSIGVIMEFANLSKLYDWAKVKRYSIKTGKYKDAGAEYRDMTEDERALLQGMVDDVLVQFKTAVSTGRKLTMEQVTKIADGRIFSGAQAKAAKLVDEVGTLQDAINEAAREAKIKGKPTVLYPAGPKKRWIEMLFDEGKGDESEAQAAPSSMGEILRRLMGATGVPVGVSDAPLIAPGVYWLWNGAR
ncbi:MAG: signal peptide peptidase SppA, partial [Bdellovibrionota bacterium]